MSGQEDVCPDLSEITRVHPANGIFGLICFIFMAVYFTATIAWWWSRRGELWLQKRNFWLMAISATGSMLQVATSGLLNFIGREKYPCEFHLIAAFLIVPLAVGPVAVRMILFSNKAQFSELLLSQQTTVSREFNPARFVKLSKRTRLRALVKYGIFGLGRTKTKSAPGKRSSRSSSSSTTSFVAGPEDVLAEANAGSKHVLQHRDSNASLNLGMRAQALFASQTAGFGMLLMLVLLLFAGSLIGYLISQPGSQYLGCKGCSIEGGDFLPLVSEVVVVFGVGMVYLVKLRGREDPFEILHEIRMIWGCGAFMVLGTVLSFLDPFGLYYEKEAFDWFHIVTLAMIVAHTIQCPMQVLRTYQTPRRRSSTTLTESSSRRGSNHSLSEVLATPDGKALFHKYLTKEFSVENILFLDSVETFQAKYKPSMVSAKRAVIIYQTFVEERSMLQVNISSKVRTAIFEKIAPFIKKNAFTGRSTFASQRGGRSNAVGQEEEEVEVDEEDTVSRSLFDNAVKEIEHLLETDTFQRFKKSQLYQEWEDGENGFA